MREILFRGKVTDEPDEWVQGYLLPNNVIWQMKPYANSKCCGVGQFTVIHETVGQYTGLNDKNGKMIFERDIVCQYNEGIDNEYLYEYRTDIGRVFWYNAVARFLRTSSTFPDDCPEMTEYCEYEVIGNAYDNPELLKGEENV